MANFWGRQGERGLVGSPTPLEPAPKQSFGPRPTSSHAPPSPRPWRGCWEGGEAKGRGEKPQGQNDSGTGRERKEARRDAGGRALGPGLQPRTVATEGPTRARPRAGGPGRVGGAARPRSPHDSPLPGHRGREGPRLPPASGAGALTHRRGGEEQPASPPAPSLALKHRLLPLRPPSPVHPPPPTTLLPALPPRRLSRRLRSRHSRHSRLSPSTGARTGARRGERARARRRHPQPPPPAGGARARRRRARARCRGGRPRKAWPRPPTRSPGAGLFRCRFALHRERSGNRVPLARPRFLRAKAQGS